MSGIRGAMTIDGTCTMMQTPNQFVTTCGLRFPAAAIYLSERGVFDEDGLNRLADAHRLHHREDHPGYGPKGHLEVQQHYDPLDGGWITVSCHH